MLLAILGACAVMIFAVLAGILTAGNTFVVRVFFELKLMVSLKVSAFMVGEAVIKGPQNVVKSILPCLTWYILPAKTLLWMGVAE